MKHNSVRNWIMWGLFIFLPPFGILYMWIVKKDFSQKKKIILSIIFAIWFLFCIVEGSSQNSINNNAQKPSENNIITNVNNEIKDEHFTNTNDIEQTTLSNYETQEISDTTKEVSEIEDNFLINCELIIKDVFNGSKDTVIGKCAFIRVTNEQLESITPDTLKEFADKIVANSEYNWVSIMSNSDIGICFPSSDILSAVYGKLDKDGSILETYGLWLLDENGNYTYTE